MTENKRFQYNVNKNTIEQNGKFVAYVNSVDGVRIANKLNVLQNENEKLKSKNRGLQSELQIFKEDATYSNLQINKLADENEQLKAICKDHRDHAIDFKADCVRLEKENEELQQFKDKVFELLHKKLEEYPYLTLTEKWDNDCKYKHSCRENHERNVAYASIHTLLNELIKELQE